MRMIRTMVAMAVLAALAACVSDAGTAGIGRLAPEPLRHAVLTLHNACLAAGLYRIGAQAPDRRADAAVAHRACGDASSITWLGHSSALIRIGGLTVLTDPVLSPQRAAGSPLPARISQPPLTLADLPPVDVILISHGDYDHLHDPSLQALAARFPDAAIATPAGAAHAVARRHFPAARALGAGGSFGLRAVTFTALPAHHETRRNLLGIRDGAAVSWEIAAPEARILFVGDSGYGPAFEAIGRSRKPYDVALVPIGAYEPRGIVSDMHTTPEEAAKIAREVGARVAIGIHWGTFALSSDRPDEARRKFIAASGGGTETRTLALGETWLLPRRR